MYNKLIIIGNGFDISHGLKTQYSEFYKTIPQDLKNNWESLDVELESKCGSWYDFEDNIDFLTQKWHDKYINHIVGDKLNNNNEKKLIKKIEKINTIFNELTSQLIEYISIENDKKTKLKEEVKMEMTDDSYIITFNYTSLIECYTKNVYYIHGSIKENFIVLGYKLRAEMTGIAFEATRYDKRKLREILNFRRYLLANESNLQIINEEMNIFLKQVDRLFSGKGGYIFEYSPSTINKIYKENNLNHIHNKFLTSNFNMFRQFYQIPEYSSELDRIMQVERLKQLPLHINNYGKKYNFHPAPLIIDIDFDLITQLVIMGHSLKADIEIYEHMFILLINLEKIILYIYEGEDYSEKLNILQRLSKNDVKFEIKIY